VFNEAEGFIGSLVPVVGALGWNMDGCCCFSNF